LAPATPRPRSKKLKVKDLEMTDSADSAGNLFDFNGMPGWRFAGGPVPESSALAHAARGGGEAIKEVTAKVGGMIDASATAVVKASEQGRRFNALSMGIIRASSKGLFPGSSAGVVDGGCYG
jgi:hypothetical protein